MMVKSGLRMKMMNNESPTDQLREHYKIEKGLATRLRNASREERLHLYSFLYDELYRLVPFHPQLIRKRSPEQTATYMFFAGNHM